MYANAINFQLVFSSYSFFVIIVCLFALFYDKVIAILFI